MGGCYQLAVWSATQYDGMETEGWIHGLRSWAVSPPLRSRAHSRSRITHGRALRTPVVPFTYSYSFALSGSTC